MNEIQALRTETMEKVKKNSKKGFTLVELVVVIAILAIIAAIAIPVVSSIINSSSKSAGDTNAQTIEFAIKEAQADITSRNEETYKNAVKDPESITIETVATKKSIQSAFEPKTYNNDVYNAYWDNSVAQVVFVTKTGGDSNDKIVDLDGKARIIDATHCILLTATDANNVTTPLNTIKIISLKTSIDETTPAAEG